MCFVAALGSANPGFAVPRIALTALSPAASQGFGLCAFSIPPVSIYHKNHTNHMLPNHRWLTKIPNPDAVENLAKNGVPKAIAPLLINRGIGLTDYHEAWDFLNSEGMSLKSPIEEFSGLAEAVALLSDNPGPIGIVGDYDTDGMTSTALLLRTFEHLGMYARYEIPSRIQEGYGINERIVREFHGAGIKLIITVDNGIHAHQPIELARGLGMQVIVTDHHELPKTLPNAIIINPKLLPNTSPWRGLAGVGVAYILGITLAMKLGKTKGLADQLLELFTIGTIVDMVPLVGVNRKFVIRGLQLLAKPKLPGLQALLEAAEIKETVKPDDIGFKLGPYINAVGRIGDPVTVLNLLSAPNLESARPFARQCREINRDRQAITSEIEKEALAMIRGDQYKKDRVIALFNPNWHQGVIGIVASRLVEKFGVPVFLMTESDDVIRGSARGTEEFNVYDALRFCQGILATWGGHKAAGGFTLYPSDLDAFRSDLISFTGHELTPEQCTPVLVLDGNIRFSEINLSLIESLDTCQPWGIENKEPIFWSNEVEILEQSVVKGGHRRVRMKQGSHTFNGIAWRWKEYELPNIVDVAYKLKLNEWNGRTNIQLEIVGARIPQQNYQFQLTDREETLEYTCSFDYLSNELCIVNKEGMQLFITPGDTIASIGPSRHAAKSVDIGTRQMFFPRLLAAAYTAAGLLVATP